MKSWDGTAGSRRRLDFVSCCVCMLQGLGYSLRRVDRAGAGGGGDEGQGGTGDELTLLRRVGD